MDRETHAAYFQAFESSCVHDTGKSVSEAVQHILPAAIKTRTDPIPARLESKMEARFGNIMAQ
eukprot:3418525-Pyramimonas_sp.AAC.1